MEFPTAIENTLGRFADQGIMFWSATGAVALGVTLILAAGYLQFQRIRSKAGRPKITDLAAEPEPVDIPAELPLDTELNSGPQKALVWLGTNTGEANSEELSHLLCRLRKAADRLDSYQRTCGRQPADSTESPLKESREGVDYLFRTGTG